MYIEVCFNYIVFIVRLKKKNNVNRTFRTIITGAGSYIPDRVVPNDEFINRSFLGKDGTPFEKSNRETILKFSEITGIEERRFANDSVLASDMGARAAEDALDMSGLDRETLDYIIVAHNFGDVRADNPRVDMVPSLASKVKHHLGIKNPYCVAYDLPFGCPGWVQGVIQASYYIGSGDARSALVIGAETLSRICDPHDRDSMIYADGAGATILEAKENDRPEGVLAHAARTDTETQAYYLEMERSFKPDSDDTLYLKMDGRKLYQYALSNVPDLVKKSLDKAGIGLDEVDKVLIHQANEKMDRAILDRLFKLYDNGTAPGGVMPMTIQKLGNTSVATVPTLLDLILRNKLDGHHIHNGDTLVFASVGAGMNINSVVYRVPGE